MTRCCIEELVELERNEDVTQTITAPEPTVSRVTEVFGDRPARTAVFGLLEYGT